MSKQVLSYLESLENSIRKYADEETWFLVREHLKGIKENTKLEDVAIKAQDAINALIRAVDEDIFLKIMSTRGSDCASSHKNSIERQKSELIKKGWSLDEYVNSLVNTPTPGIHYYREGKELYLVYKTQELKMRCYCHLLRKLPDEFFVPQEYCECSRAFIQYTWEQLFDRHVTVDLLQSCLTGKGECKFRIIL